MPHNVLITSAGRRALLVQMFQRELKHVFPGACVYATDLCPLLSSACQVADGAFVVPPVSDANYADTLLRLCRENSIGLVIATIDTELPLLAEQRDRFLSHGVQVVVSSPMLTTECRDKRLTGELFARYGVAYPRRIDPAVSPDIAVIAKPYDGSCSKDLRVFSRAVDVPAQLLADPRMVLFEYLPHDRHDEYTVDMYYDRQGELKCLVPRLRIETRGGEVSKGKTCRIAAIESLRQSFNQVPGARGCLTAQFFVNKSTGAVTGIEINPRFGGGFPLSYEAGANFPRWIIEEYLGDQPISEYDDWTDQLTMLRYDAHVLVSGSAA